MIDRFVYRLQSLILIDYFWNRATGISEVLVTPRYLVKTRRLHKQKQQQNAQELSEGTLILPHAAKVEMEEDEGGDESSIVPHSESD